jgi:glycosyltransferase 2 family protein
VKWAITFVLMAWAYHRISPQEVGLLLQRTNLNMVILFGFLLFLNTSISTLKWRRMLVADGVQIPFKRLFGNYLIGSFFNLFMPSTVGGDLYRLAATATFATKAKSASSILADRLSGFLAIMSMGLFASFFSMNYLGDKKTTVVAGLLLSLLAGIFFMLMHKEWSLMCMRIAGFEKRASLYGAAERCLDSFDVYRKKPGLLRDALILSLLFQCVFVVCIIVLTRSMSIEIPLIMYFVFVPLITMLEAIPLGVFGMGWRDWGYVWFFTAAKVPDASTASAAFVVLYLGITVLYVSLGGVLLLVRAVSATKT